MSNDAGSDRRTLLRLTACALGGGLATATGAPLLRMLADPASKTTVTTPTTPIDLGAADRVPADEPINLPVIAPQLRDGWNAARDVVLGSAWLSRTSTGALTAFSSVCPHLSCAIGWSQERRHYICPCHDSLFSPTGERVSGPSERGLDPLPVTIKDGRIQLTWQRFRAGGAKREPV